MSYQRQLENVWLRLQDPDAPAPRHATTTRFAFDDVCAAFIQAEMGPEIDEAGKRAWKEKDEMSDDIRMYRAEWNVWAYYYGEQDPFPGLDPALQVQEQEQSHFTESRQGDYYVPDYAIQSTERERDKQDIGAALRGSVHNAQRGAVERGRNAIERRERQAEQFMKHRRDKNYFRRERKKEREASRLISGEDEGRYLDREEERREREAREWMENYGRDGDGYQEHRESYDCKGEEYDKPADGSGRWDGEYQPSTDYPGAAEKDEKTSIHRKRMRERQKTKKAAEKLERKMLRDQTRQRSMSPTRHGGGREWRGDEFGGRNVQDYQGRGHEASDRKERGRYEDMGWSGRGDVMPGDYDHRRSMEGSKQEQHRGEERFREHGREHRERADLVNRNYERHPPTLCREDARRLVEDDSEFGYISKWAQDGREREDDPYRRDVFSHPRRKTAETATEDRRDRGFGILKDENEYYREDFSPPQTPILSSFCAPPQIPSQPPQRQQQQQAKPPPAILLLSSSSPLVTGIMIYRSVAEEIWSRLAVEGSARHPMTVREEFDSVCEAFYQAEHCLYSEKSSIHVKMYRAEWHIHVYYFKSHPPTSRLSIGENSSFLGFDPAVVSAYPSAQLAATELENFTAPSATNIGIPSISSAIMPPEIASTSASAPLASTDNPLGSITPEEALANKQMLEHRLASRSRYQRPCHIQLGWNPATGEPWFAVRSYADNAYPAIWGRNDQQFVLQFERFPSLGYVLIWTELADPRLINYDEVWDRFHQFRQFLEEWARMRGNVEMMDKCLERFFERSEDTRLGLPVPAGFVLDQRMRDQVAGAPAPAQYIRR
ncbi:hypothetical protein IFR05_013377 [Cadophora sp. M221]|nr:hypothetical protein IFR05_013377 [Cadophora sp. M221]